MFLVKKQHLQITEDQIMKLPTGSFIVSHKAGVDTVAVRKRSCPHGADTPLIEAKPFTADLSQALGNLREEITKAVEAKKGEESIIKRQEKEIGQLREQVKQLLEKVNIKLSVKEMLSENQPIGVMTPTSSKEDKESKEKLEKKLEFLELKEKHYKEQLERAEKDLKTYDELRTWLRIALNIQNIYDNIHKVEEKIPAALPSTVPTANGDGAITIGLQRVKKILSLEEARLIVPTIRTDTVKGKILALAQNSFFDTWQSVGDISAKLVDDFRFNTSDQAINGALKELVDEQILGMKHTDRNRWKLASDVIFESKKEAK
jgi:hypothetical protein